MRIRDKYEYCTFTKRVIDINIVFIHNYCLTIELPLTTIGCIISKLQMPTFETIGKKSKVKSKFQCDNRGKRSK